MMDAVNELADPRFGIGSNAPPSGAELARERAERLVAAADAWSGIAAIATTEQADRAKDTLDQLRAEWKRMDEERVAEKRPHDQAALDVQKRWKPVLAMIEACAAVIKPLHDGWLRREDERLARERREAEEQAAVARREAETATAAAAAQANASARLAATEAEKRAQQAAEAAAAIPDRARTSGSYGRPARSLRTVWMAEIEKIDLTFRHYRRHAEVGELLTRLANADARAGARSIPGVRIYSEKV